MSALSPLLVQATPVQAVRGEGVWLFDDEGRRYLDLTAGIGVTSTGHCHPVVVEAVQRQAAQLLHGQYTTVRHPLLDELADALAVHLPGMESVSYATSGGEAVEAALRLVRHATGRPNIIGFLGGFHGRSIGAASLTASKRPVREGIAPLMAGVEHAPFPDAYRLGWSEEAAVEHCLDQLDYLFLTTSAPAETAAIIIEPVLGEGGYVPAPAAFLAGLRQRCDEHGILLVADEVQTGVGRTGTFWCIEQADVRPDVIITAKGLASGMPLSAIAAAPELMAKGLPGSQGGTYGGNPVACAAALATLRVIADEGLVDNAARMGERLRAGCDALAEHHPLIGDVRGRGLMLGLELVDSPGLTATEASAAVRAAAVEAGMLTLPCGPRQQVVRLIPALIADAEIIDLALEALDTALTAVEATLG